MTPGLYLREERESSLTSGGVQVLLCQYLTVHANQSLSISTVVYMDGDTCVNSPATPVLMETLEAEVTQAVPVNLTVPITDDRRSDLLGAFALNATDDTFQR